MAKGKAEKGAENEGNGENPRDFGEDERVEKTTVNPQETDIFDEVLKGGPKKQAADKLREAMDKNEEEIAGGVLNFFVVLQLRRNGHEIDRLMLLIKIRDRLKDNAVRRVVEIFRCQEIGDFDDRLGIQQKCTQNRPLSFECVGLGFEERRRRNHGFDSTQRAPSRNEKPICFTQQNLLR